MDDDSFEDSFESSSDSETQQDIMPAYSEREDFTQQGSPYSQQAIDGAGGRSNTFLQPPFHSQSSPFEPDASTVLQQQHGSVTL